MKNKMLARTLPFLTAFAMASQGLPLPVLAQTTSSVVSSKSSLSAQEELARDYAVSSGRQNFLMLDKKRAEIVGFEGGKEIFRNPVFLGRVLSDDRQVTLGATPAGAFNAVVRDISAGKKSGAFERFGSFIPYLCVPGIMGPKKIRSPEICYSIHPTLQTSAEKKALAAGSPDARRISNACIRDTGYQQTEAFINRHQNEGSMLLIILPNNQSKTREYLHIPPSFKPDIALN